MLILGTTFALNYDGVEVILMKIAFISDIHGNAVALEAVLENIHQQKVDEIIVLGDIAYRGPEPKRALEMIRSLDTKVIKGNADEWILRGVEKGEVPDQALSIMQEEQKWTVGQLDEEDIDYLRHLPTDLFLEVELVTIHAFHATPTSLFEVVLPEATDQQLVEKLTKIKPADLYLYGHIHKAYKRVADGKTILNLGSVGLPFDGISQASYAIVELHQGAFSTSHVRVPYDTERVCQQYEKVQYPNKEMMKNIIITGRND